MQPIHIIICCLILQCGALPIDFIEDCWTKKIHRRLIYLFNVKVSVWFINIYVKIQTSDAIKLDGMYLLLLFLTIKTDHSETPKCIVGSCQECVACKKKRLLTAWHCDQEFELIFHSSPLLQPQVKSVMFTWSTQLWSDLNLQFKFSCKLGCKSLSSFSNVIMSTIEEDFFGIFV